MKPRALLIRNSDGIGLAATRELLGLGWEVRGISRSKSPIDDLSSVADELLSPDAPSCHASKAGFSNYLESRALALGPKGIYVTNVRFGFVDAKMAKGDRKVFMMSVERAAEHLLRCIERKPARYTAPWFLTPLVRFRDFMLRLKMR